MLYIFVAYLRDMYKTVLMNSYINEYAEINNISNCTVKYHTGLKAVNIRHICSQQGRRQFISWISAGLCKFVCDVSKRHFTYSEFIRQLLYTDGSDLLFYRRNAARNICELKSALFKKCFCRLIAFGVY